MSMCHSSSKKQAHSISTNDYGSPTSVCYDRNHALAFSDTVGQQGQVVAFEPQQFMMQVSLR